MKNEEVNKPEDAPEGYDMLTLEEPDLRPMIFLYVLAALSFSLYLGIIFGKL